MHDAWVKLGTRLDRRLCYQNQPNNQINKCVGKAIASQYIFEFVIFVNERIEVQESSSVVRILISLNNIVAVCSVETLENIERSSTYDQPLVDTLNKTKCNYVRKQSDYSIFRITCKHREEA